MSTNRRHFPDGAAVDWRRVADVLVHGLAVVDEQGRIVACNAAATALLELEPVGRRLAELGLEAVSDDGEALAADEFASALTAGRGVLAGLRTRAGAQRWLRVHASERSPSAPSVLTFADVTTEHEHQLAWRRLAELDDLTKLPNRRQFLDVLERHLDSQRREDARGALLLLDLDRFKELNDTFGHAAGDRLLVQVAAALRERLRDDDVLARLGGDEFAVLLRRASAHEAPEWWSWRARPLARPSARWRAPTPRCTAPRKAVAAAGG